MTTEPLAQGIGIYGMRGFTLQHPDDLVLLLLHDGELVARFSQVGATEKSLQAECARHLAMKHGWDGCLGTGSRT